MAAMRLNTGPVCQKLSHRRANPRGRTINARASGTAIEPDFGAANMQDAVEVKLGIF